MNGNFGRCRMTSLWPKRAAAIGSTRTSIGGWPPNSPLWSALPEGRLIAIATFSLDHAGVAQIDAIAAMAVNENWIPVEHSYDAELLDALTRRRASYLKGLRYNLPARQPLASVILREDGAAPV